MQKILAGKKKKHKNETAVSQESGYSFQSDNQDTMHRQKCCSSAALSQAAEHQSLFILLDNISAFAQLM